MSDNGKAFLPDFTFLYFNLLCASVANAICRGWYTQGKPGLRNDLMC